MAVIEYVLMHKTVPCGIVLLDDSGKNLVGYRSLKKGNDPFLGNADEGMMKKWWETRVIPGTREGLREILSAAGCENSMDFSAKNLALSISDTYWICPVDSGLQWDQVKLHAQVNTYQGRILYHNTSSFSPNATLGGQMDKYWDMTGDKPVLVKKAYRSFGQQSLNEQFATMIHESQGSDIAFVKYNCEKTFDNAVISRCNAFTTEDTELLSAYEIINSCKRKNDISLYDTFINICVENGIPEEKMQNFMDYQTLTDFVISNEDEHLLNFGILRDADTLGFLAPAPIFDSGNSMFYLSHLVKPWAKYELLNIKISAFHSTEEKMLSHVKNKDIVDISRLPSKDEAFEFYYKNGIPEERAAVIAENYHSKVALLVEFTSGAKISAYIESKRR